MRTKVLLCAAALAAGALTSMAQSNVYSLNVVGYVNLSLAEGYNMVANQLDADGTGTNNTIAGVIGTNVPVNTVVYTFDQTQSKFNIATYANVKGTLKWTGASTASLNPGQGAWIYIPTGSGAQTVTTVGNVLQGSLSNPNFLAGGGFTLISSQIPLSGGLQTGLNYIPTTNDTVYLWTGTKYDIHTYANIKGVNKWNPSEPTINVGQGFWISAAPGASWKTNFTVQ